MNKIKTFMSELIDKVLWYSKEQRFRLSNYNLNLAIVLFILTVAYSSASLYSAILGNRLEVNGVTRIDYAFIILIWSLSGLFMSWSFKNLAKLNMVSTRLITLLNNIVLYYNLIFFIVLTNVYMIRAIDKVKPVMVFGIIIGIYTICASINPFVLTLSFVLIYYLSFPYIKNCLGIVESVIAGVYVLFFIIFVFLKALTTKAMDNHTISLKKINDDTNKKYIEQLKINSNIQKDTIMKLINLVESRDINTDNHSDHISNIVRLISEELVREGIYTEVLNDNYIEMLADLSPLYDIGKIKITDMILNAPRYLNDVELLIMRQHTVYGYNIIDNMLSLQDINEKELAKEIALYHHERWDGHGYPKGLNGNLIPVSARIVAIADSFEALITKRCYENAYTHDEAYNIIKNESGSHFDPIIVNAFLNIRDSIEELYCKEDNKVG